MDRAGTGLLARHGALGGLFRAQCGESFGWPRTKIRHLLALGVNFKTAIRHGVSSKSYWHMARTPAVQQALSIAWLKAQGLVSVKDLWCKAQGYTT